MVGVISLPVETNLSDQAQEVRFLLLVLAPTVEKGKLVYFLVRILKK